MDEEANRLGTHKTVNARLRPWLSGIGPEKNGELAHHFQARLTLRVDEEAAEPLVGLRLVRVRRWRPALWTPDVLFIRRRQVVHRVSSSL